MYRHVNFSANHRVRFDKSVKRFNNTATCGVFYWHNSKIAMAAAYLVKDRTNISNCLIFNTLAELEQMIEELDIDDDIGMSKLKNSNVRYLLSDLYQKDRIGSLLELMQQPSNPGSDHQH